MTTCEAEGVRLFCSVTNHFRPWDLAGSHNAAVRARIMSAILGARVPQARAGVTALEAELCRVCGVGSGTCRADREEKLTAFLERLYPAKSQERARVRREWEAAACE